MKKIINTSFIYAILAIVLGIFYREYTKAIGYTGLTKLSILQNLIFNLGVFFFLILAVLNEKLKITEHKYYKVFYILYNVGLIISIFGFFIRGIVEVNQMEISKVFNSSIVSITGLGHMTLTITIVMFIVILCNIFYNLKK